MTMFTARGFVVVLRHSVQTHSLSKPVFKMLRPQTGNVYVLHGICVGGKSKLFLIYAFSNKNACSIMEYNHLLNSLDYQLQ